MRLFAIVLQQT